MAAKKKVASKAVKKTEVTVEVIEQWDTIKDSPLPSVQSVATKNFVIWKKIANQLIQMLNDKKMITSRGDAIELTPKVLESITNVMDKVQKNMFEILEKDTEATITKLTREDKRILYIDGLLENDI